MAPDPLYVPLLFIKRFPLDIRAPRTLVLFWVGIFAPADPLLDRYPPVPFLCLIFIGI